MSKTGWWTPTPNRRNAKFHYIADDAFSLCKRWIYINGYIEEGRDDHPNNCKPCRLALAQRRAKEEKER